MTDLVIVRHAESVWNAEGRWQGWADPPLSPLGERQATEAGRALASATDPLAAPDIIAASDLRRARHTAALLTAGPPTAGPPTADPPTADPPTAGPPTAGPPTADRNTPDRATPRRDAPRRDAATGRAAGRTLIEPGLREYDTGDWTGLRRPDIAARWPEQLADWDAGRVDRTPGGEEHAAFVARLFAALERIRRAVPDGRVLAVSHGRAIHALGKALGAPAVRIDHLTGWRLHLGRAPVLVSAVSLRAVAAGTAAGGLDPQQL